MKGRTVRRLLAIVLALAVAVALGGYVLRNHKRISELFSMGVPQLLAFAGLMVGSVATRGEVNKLFYREMGASISSMEGSYLAVMNTYGNLVPLSGGLFAKGLYLKSRHSIGLSQYLPATIALSIVFISVNGLLGLGALILLSLRESAVVPAPLYAGFGLMTSGILLVWLPVGGWLPKRLRRVSIAIAQGWSILRRKPSLLSSMMVLQVAHAMLIAMRLKVVFSTYSQQLSLVECVLVSAATLLTRLFSIVPGGIGIREAIVGGLSTLLGIDFGLGLLAASTDRLVALLFPLPLMALLYIRFRRRSGCNVENREPKDEEGA